MLEKNGAARGRMTGPSPNSRSSAVDWRSLSASETEPTPSFQNGSASRALFLPDYSESNPYQRLLATGLAEEGVRVDYAGIAALFPFPILAAWLARGCPGVVHIHWTHEFLGVTSTSDTRPLARARFFGQLRLLRRLNVRIVWTLHNLGAHEGGHGPSERAAHKRLIALADAVICHCSAARDSAISAFELGPRDRDKLHVIPHGNYAGVYPDTIDRATARRRLALPMDARVFLFIGALRGYKGLEELIDAFRAVPEPEARLIVAGMPNGESVAASLGRAAAADSRISLRLEFLPPEELQVYLRACDLVVLPFRDILTSGSAILALSFGRPVIAPSLGCLPETIPADAGLLYDPNSPGALAETMRKAMSTNLVPMEFEARFRANELAWRPIAAKTAALYRG